ncbi:MAG: transglutaminase domain-containing protein [Anaerovoracaceae bacterium]
MKKNKYRRVICLVISMAVILSALSFSAVFADENTDDAPPQPEIKSVRVTGYHIARIDWSKVKEADGYILSRRSSGSDKWKNLITIDGSEQTYANDFIISRKTYYYRVIAYKKTSKDGEVIIPDEITSGYRKTFSKNTVNTFKGGSYSRGSVYGPQLSSKQLASVKKSVKRFCRKYITTDMNSIEKIYAAQIYLADTCVYAARWDRHGANTAWGALVYKNKNGNHEAQCSGYARGMKALLDGAGVGCRFVHANTRSANPSHQWNFVKAGGKWYIVDPQLNSQTASSYGFYAAFMCGSSYYQKNTGMRWNKSSYPKVSKSSYPSSKLVSIEKGYKVSMLFERVYNYR